MIKRTNYPVWETRLQLAQAHLDKNLCSTCFSVVAKEFVGSFGGGLVRYDGKYFVEVHIKL